MDYHYLGDPIEATSRQPKALDEVMALYAGKSWVNEPGTKWDWSISGFQLLVVIVERVSGQRFADYVQGSAARLKMDPSDFGAPLSGDRIGTGDPVTFRRQLQ